MVTCPTRGLSSRGRTAFWTGRRALFFRGAKPLNRPTGNLPAPATAARIFPGSAAPGRSRLPGKPLSRRRHGPGDWRASTRPPPFSFAAAIVGAPKSAGSKTRTDSSSRRELCAVIDGPQATPRCASLVSFLLVDVGDHPIEIALRPAVRVERLQIGPNIRNCVERHLLQDERRD